MGDGELNGGGLGSLGIVGRHVAGSGWAVRAPSGGMPRAGAKLESTDPQGRTALHAACLKSLLEVARQLLEKGAYIDAQDAQGNTCLHFAAKNGADDVARLLMASGARSDLQNKEMKTPVDLGIECKHISIVQTIRLMRRTDGGRNTRDGRSGSGLVLGDNGVRGTATGADER